MMRALPFFNIVAFIATLMVNVLAQTPIMNGTTTAAVANRYPDSLYFPANTAFAIWGIIYAFIIAYLVYQALPAQRNNVQLNKIGVLFIASNVFNALWLIAFQYEQFVLSMVFMLGLLVALLTLYIRLDIGGALVSLRDKWLVHVPFSLYLGWITAATIANATFVLTDLGWDGFGIENEVWAVIMLIVTGVVGGFMVLSRRDVAYGLVIVWAVGWIAARYWNSAFTTTAYTAAFVSGLVALMVAYRLYVSLTQDNKLKRATA